MRRSIYFIVILSVLGVMAALFLFERQQKPLLIQTAAQRANTPDPKPTTAVSLKTPPQSYTLPQPAFVSQSFNNCGPASLSMVMSMFGKHVDQETLADRMRPYHNPEGGVDDKSIFAPEFVRYAKEYEFEALERPNGDLDTLKLLIANDIPVVVRTWLHPNEDIGHFRIVRGYNEETQTLLQDDSYEGPNLSYSYDEFLSLWQPFNYGYILIYPKEKQAVVAAILGENSDAKKAYQNSIVRAQRELKDTPSAVYPYFNISTSQYHLGDYTASVANYEKAAADLPPRMLWYQIEPILAYQKTGADDTVLRLTDNILNNGNKAYSELYQIRGEVYQKQGNRDAARQEFENAVYYNENFQPAKEALERLD